MKKLMQLVLGIGLIAGLNGMFTSNQALADTLMIDQGDTTMDAIREREANALMGKDYQLQSSTPKVAAKLKISIGRPASHHDHDYGHYHYGSHVHSQCAHNAEYRRWHHVVRYQPVVRPVYTTKRVCKRVGRRGNHVKCHNEKVFRNYQHVERRTHHYPKRHKVRHHKGHQHSSGRLVINL